MEETRRSRKQFKLLDHSYVNADTFNMLILGIAELQIWCSSFIEKGEKD